MDFHADPAGGPVKPRGASHRGRNSSPSGVLYFPLVDWATEDTGVRKMDEGRNGMVDWTRRRKMVAAGLIAATLTVGIMIGTLVSDRVSAMRSFSFSGTNAAALALPDPIPSSNSFNGIVNRVEPAVVNIATTQSTSTCASESISQFMT